MHGGRFANHLRNLFLGFRAAQVEGREALAQCLHVAVGIDETGIDRGAVGVYGARLRAGIITGTTNCEDFPVFDRQP